MRKLVLVLTSLVFCIGSHATTIFQNSAEDSTEKWNGVSEFSKKLVIESMDDKNFLDAEIREKGLSKNHSPYLVEKPVPLGKTGGNYTFVRPATEPYLSTFYGAHVFRYWIIGNGKIIFLSASDRFSILSSSHNNMRDIVVTNYRGGWIYDDRYIFNSKKFYFYDCKAYLATKPSISYDCNKVPGPHK